MLQPANSTSGSGVCGALNLIKVLYDKIQMFLLINGLSILSHSV